MSSFRITGPDGATYNVTAPEGATEQEVLARVQQQAAAEQQPSMGDYAKDIGMSTGVGIGEGVLGLAAIPGTIVGAADAGVNALAKNTLGRLENRYKNGSWDVPKDWDERRANLQKNVDASGPFKLPAVQDTISYDKIKKGVEGVTGEFYDPKTIYGNYARSIGQALPGSVMAPGNMALNALRYGVLPGAASETAGQATKGTAAEPWARAAAGVGTAVGAAALSRPALYERMIGADAKNALPAAGSPDKFALAKELMREAESRGVKLTTAEAMDAATSGATNMGRRLRVAEQTPGSREKLEPFFAARPGQVQSATEDVMNRVAPAPSRPYDIAPAVRDVGEKARKAAEAYRTRAASPYYQAAENDVVNPNAVRAITKEFDAAAAKDTTGILSAPVNEGKSLLYSQAPAPATPAVVSRNARGIMTGITPAKPATAGTVATDINNLDRARKFLRDKAELPPFDARAIPKDEGRVVGGLTVSLRDRMERNSPNFAQGRAVYEGKSPTVDKLAQSPTGQLAEASTPEAQRSILFSGQPLPNSERAIGNAVKSVANKKPDLARALVRQELEQQANKTTHAGIAGGKPDQFGGAKFAKAVNKNPQYSKNLASALDASGAGSSDVSRLVDVLGATGWRQPAGSLTAFNQLETEALKAGGLPNLVAGVMKSPQKIKDWLDRARLSNNSEKLADLLLSGPEGIDVIKRLAQSSDATARNFAVRPLLSYQASQK